MGDSSWRDLILLSSFGVVSIVALACVNYSLKLAAASVVAPYQYTLILWAVVLGYVVFGDVPDAFTLAGAAVIIAAWVSTILFWREQSARASTLAPLAERLCTNVAYCGGCDGLAYFCAAHCSRSSWKRSHGTDTPPSARMRVSATPVHT